MKPRNNYRNPSPIRRSRPSLLACSVAACFAAAPAWALPTGAQVAAGNASFSQAGNHLTIANTPGAIINWNAFSIGALESVRFDQQNSLSAVLNRVTGGSASAIHGALSSNGRVFLINPNGILFGAGSRIDVQGLIASTLNISDADFLAGRLDFQAGATAGAIRNAGALQAAPGGSIYLIAPDIENSGIVRAPNGEVLLAAGRQVSLVDGGHPDIQVVVSAPEDKAVNLGDLVAGKIGVFGALLAQRGTASADTVETDAAGRIVFRASKRLDVDAGSRTTANGDGGGTVVLQSAGDTYVKGTVEATGKVGAGGTVAVLGERVAVMDAATVDASGASGGGRILVGGDYQGKNDAVQNAHVTWFGPDASLKADAQKVGAGGTVIVWADDTTRAHGSISARGGSEGGDGGFVETSGKRFLEATRAPDIGAPKGTGGVWLLDPSSLTIDNSNNLNITESPTGVFDDTTDSTNAYLNVDVLKNALEQTGDGTVSVTASENLTINAAIAQTTGSKNLTLTAGRDLEINAAITLKDTNLTSHSGDKTTISAAVDVGSGNLDITATDLALNGSGSLKATNVNITALDGTIGLGTTGTMSISGTELQNIYAHQLTLTGATGIDVNGITAAQSANIGKVKLQFATANPNPSAGITFGADPGSDPSTFKALEVRSNAGIFIRDNLTTTAGPLILDSDADSPTTSGPHDAIFIGGSTSRSVIKLEATDGLLTIGDGDHPSSVRQGTESWYTGSVQLVGKGVVLHSAWVQESTMPHSLTINAGSDELRINGGITTKGNVSLTAGTVTQTKAITTDTLAVNATSENESITLDHIGNSVSRFQANASGSISFKNNGAFEAEAVSGSGNITLYNQGSGNISTFQDSYGLQADRGDITIHGDLLNAGTISIGSELAPVHTLTVNGKFSQTRGGEQSDGGMLWLHTDSTGHSSVTVTDTATLGGALRIQGSPASVNYPVLTAGSISGTFDSISSAYTPTYTSTSLSLDRLVQTIIWNGGSSGDWNTKANWIGGELPTSTDNVDLGNAAVTLSADGWAKNIDCGYCSLTVGASTGSPVLLTLTGNGSLHNLILEATGSIKGADTKALEVTNHFTQHQAATISGFNYVFIDTPSSLTVGHISTAGFGQSLSGTSGVIRLKSRYGTITQHGGTNLAGSAVRATAYTDITLEGNNSTGVVAGRIIDSGNFRYKSTNPIHVTTVKGQEGIHISTAGVVRLESKADGEAFSQSAPIVASDGLLLVGTGNGQSVNLTDTGNDFRKLAMKMSGSVSEVAITQGGSAGMRVGDMVTVGNDSASGLTLPGLTKLTLINANTGPLSFLGNQVINQPNAAIELASGGDLSISAQITAKSIKLAADGQITLPTDISPGGAVTASDFVQISNWNGAGNGNTPAFIVANDTSSCDGPCIGTNSFSSIAAPGGIIFGSDTTMNLSVIDAIDADSFAGATKPVSIALLSAPSGDIEVYAPVNAHNGHFVFSGGSIVTYQEDFPITTITAAKVAGKAASGELHFSGINTEIVNFTLPMAVPKTFNGIDVTGSLTMTHADGRFIDGGGTVKAATLDIEAQGIGTAGSGSGIAAAPLATRTPNLRFIATDGDAFITNNAGQPGPVNVTGNASGQIGFINYGTNDGNGATTITSHDSDIGMNAAGNIALTANSPLTIESGATVKSTGGSISLTAGSGGDLTVDGSVSAPNGTVSAAAGSLSGSGTLNSISPADFKETSAFTNNGSGNGSVSPPPPVPVPPPPPPPPPPTIGACVANPALTGCSGVLPTLDACVTNPAAAGCSAVLPPLATCATAPATPGCTAVLPTLDACVANPAAAGCSAVLPPLNVCIATPTAAGCSAVLPPLASCTTAPATPGCSAVLPSLDACVTNPSAAGCSAVLPRLSSCIAAPTMSGCSVVLPSLPACVANPAAIGCSAVLPPLASCTTAPTTPGCSVVLPSLPVCVANPAASGCSAVLPPLSTCIANPAAAGCSAVLPSVADCIVQPTAAGCTTVLPSLASCAANPAMPGCSVVLPPTNLPVDQQLNCLNDPTACASGTPPPATGGQTVQQVQASEQQVVFNSQTVQSSSGRPDLTLAAGGGGGAGASGGAAGTGQPAGQSTSQSSPSGEGEGEGEGEGNGKQTGQNTPTTQQGANDAPPQRRFCN